MFHTKVSRETSYNGHESFKISNLFFLTMKLFRVHILVTDIKTNSTT